MPASNGLEFTDYQQQLDAINRRRNLAQALQMQALHPIEGQQAPGQVIPISPFQGVAKLAEAYAGGNAQNKLDQQGQDVSSQYQQDLVKALTQAQSSMQGTPSIPPDPQETQQAQDQGQPAPQPSQAVPPNPNAAVAAYLQHPATQGMGLSLQQNLNQNEMRKQLLAQILKQTGNQPSGNPMTPGAGSSVGPSGTPPQAQAAQANNVLSGIDPVALGLMMSGDKELADTGKTLLEAHKGVAQRANAPIVDPMTGRVISQPVPVPTPGAQINVGPQGNTMSQVPGALPAMQAGAEATELGKSMGSFHPTQTGGGATVPVLGRNIQSGQISQQATGGSLYRPQPGDPWASIPKLQTPSGIGQTTFQREYQAKQGENATKLGEKFGTQADMSNQRLAYNQQASELVDKADTGPLALQSAQVKNWLVSNFKIPEEDFKNTPSATIALNKDLLNAAAEKAKQRYGSRMTQSEVMLQIKQGAPNVDMTKAAIKYLLDSDSAMAGYHIKQSEDYGKYIQMGGDPMRFEGWYARNFPMSKDVGKVQLKTKQPSIDDLIRQYARPQ